MPQMLKASAILSAAGADMRDAGAGVIYHARSLCDAVVLGRAEEYMLRGSKPLHYLIVSHAVLE